MIKKPGIWVTNGHPGNTITNMYKWNPGSITCIFDYLQINDVFDYKKNNPNTTIIIRFQHPHNWQDNIEQSGKNYGEMIASKWPEIKELNPYVYFANEMNLHYESDDPIDMQWSYYNKPEFYQKFAQWVEIVAKTIKNLTPDMKLITPPFAFGHNEDGVDENGVAVSIEEIIWAGYDYLAPVIEKYFDNILTFHAYWGDGSGSIKERLYNKELSSWYAFRWKRVLELFEKRYNMNCKMIIDEAGNFSVKDSDFTDQIVYYAKECFKDDRILALTYFLWFDPTKSPGNILNSWVDNLSEEELEIHLEKMKIFSLTDILPIEPLPPVPDNKMIIDVEYEKSALPLIVGVYPKNNVAILVQPPFGNSYTVYSNSKPEFGEGGFEAGYANLFGDYILTIEDKSYKVQCKADGSLIRISFEENNIEDKYVILKSNAITKEEAEEIMNNYPDVFTIEETLLNKISKLLRIDR